jgi:PhnB protein
MFMQSRLNPYLGFQGKAREAMEFYKSVLGGTLDVQTYKQAGMQVAAGEEAYLMHGALEADNGIVIMGADIPSGMEFRGGASTISLALNGDDYDELQGYYEKLCDGGKADMPLSKAPWGDFYGECTDKYGFRWLVNITDKK